MLKSLTFSILFKDDNYLQTHSTVELYRFRNFSAYLKLLYAIRLSSSRKRILRAFFHKFKNILSDFVPLNTISLKRCFVLRLGLQGQYHSTYFKRVFLLWKQVAVLIRPNPVKLSLT
jgi:hypothetical protein